MARQRSRSAALIQVSFQAVLRELLKLPKAVLLGAGVDGADLTSRIVHMAPYILLNVAMGAAMHDAKATLESRELASVNGVEGGGWELGRCQAWMAAEYPLMDTVFLGISGCHEKKDISRELGFRDFFQMEIESLPIVRRVFAQLDARLWDARLDVYQPGFRCAWGDVFGRTTPPNDSGTLLELKKNGDLHDPFHDCPKVVLLLLGTSWDGAFDGNVHNQGRTGGALVMMAVPEDAFGERHRFVELVYELPPEYHRAFAGLEGSHLLRALIFYALTGRSYGELTKAPKAKEEELRAELDALYATAMAELAQRRRDARAALQRALALATDIACISGAEPLGTADVLIAEDGDYFEALRLHAYVSHTLWPGELRPGAERVARLAIEDKANAPTLRKLAPASELGRLRAQMLEEMRAQREALQVRRLQTRPVMEVEAEAPGEMRRTRHSVVAEEASERASRRPRTQLVPYKP